MLADELQHAGAGRAPGRDLVQVLRMRAAAGRRAARSVGVDLVLADPPRRAGAAARRAETWCRC